MPVSVMMQFSGMSCGSTVIATGNARTAGRGMHYALPKGKACSRVRLTDAWLANHPEAGEVIPGTGGGRKVRWNRAGSGKSSGARVIYYHLAEAGQIILVAVYGKAARENMPAHEIRKLAK